MHVGKRVARLRAAHGESLREAAIRTGVSHTTIARIEKGEVTGSFHSTLRKIAEGYNVQMEFMLTGRDPRQDFEMAVRRLPAEERSRLYFVSPRTRIRLVVDFLLAEYPNEFSLPQLSKAMGYEISEMQALIEQAIEDDASDEFYAQLADAISRITGISPQWFRWGTLAGDKSDLVPKEMASAYISLMRKAARAGIRPQMLDMALDLLIMKTKEASPPA